MLVSAIKPRQDPATETKLKQKEITFDSYIVEKYKKDKLNDKLLCKILLKSKRSNRSSQHYLKNIFDSLLEKKIRNVISEYNRYNESLEK